MTTSDGSFAKRPVFILKDMAKGGDLDVSVVLAQVIPERRAPVTVLLDAGGAPIGTGGARLGHLCKQCRNADGLCENHTPHS